MRLACSGQQDSRGPLKCSERPRTTHRDYGRLKPTCTLSASSRTTVAVFRQSKKIDCHIGCSKLSESCLRRNKTSNGLRSKEFTPLPAAKKLPHPNAKNLAPCGDTALDGDVANIQYLCFGGYPTAAWPLIGLARAFVGHASADALRAVVR